MPVGEVTATFKFEEYALMFDEAWMSLHDSNPKDPDNRVLGPKYYDIVGIWPLKPYYLGPWTLNPKPYISPYNPLKGPYYLGPWTLRANDGFLIRLEVPSSCPGSPKKGLMEAAAIFTLGCIAFLLSAGLGFRV